MKVMSYENYCIMELVDEWRKVLGKELELMMVVEEVGIGPMHQGQTEQRGWCSSYYYQML